MSDENPNYDTEPDAYLAKLREHVLREATLVHDPEGVLRFGFRCWPDRREQPILDAALDGLAVWHRTRGIEMYAVMIDGDAELSDADAWTEAWRASDRTRVFAGPFHEVFRRVFDSHEPRTRG
jgi:hypothetical protein